MVKKKKGYGTWKSVNLAWAVRISGDGGQEGMHLEKKKAFELADPPRWGRGGRGVLRADALARRVEVRHLLAHDVARQRAEPAVRREHQATSRARAATAECGCAKQRSQGCFIP